jgi:peptidoglycan/LPS O-acetylase OafA/YrhL
MIAIPSNDHLVCEENYWRNILYVDVFRPYFARCMPWAWFIAVEVQFYIVGALLLMISRSHRRYATVILMSFYASSVITTVLIRVYGQNKAFGSLAEDALVDFNGIYREPWVRIGPFVVGIFFGYFLKRTDSQICYKSALNTTGKSGETKDLNKRRTRRFVLLQVGA